MLKTFKTGLKKEYLELTEKEFNLIFRRTMNNEDFQNYLKSVFNEEYNHYTEDKALKEMKSC